MEKAYNLVNARQVLSGVFGQKMKASLSFIISNNMKLINEALEEFDKSQKELYSKYGDEPDEQGNIRVSGEKVEDFTTELNEIAGVELPIEVTKFTMSNLDDLELSPSEIQAISWMIEQ